MDESEKLAHDSSQWWLVLIDRIGYSMDEYDEDLFGEHPEIEHNWDKILLLNPLVQGWCSRFHLGPGGPR
jgi:hypothetical protein